MNRVTLIGRVTKDTELITTTNGVNIAKNTIAVNRKFRNADGEYEADFINIVAWRNVADLLDKYVKKGDRIGIIGSIQTRSYDAQDGSRRYVAEVVVDELEFLENKNNNNESEVSNLKLEPISDDDLPF
jgi:single-strand DNA-binding protein